MGAGCFCLPLLLAKVPSNALLSLLSLNVRRGLLHKASSTSTKLEHLKDLAITTSSDVLLLQEVGCKATSASDEQVPLAIQKLFPLKEWTTIIAGAPVGRPGHHSVATFIRGQWAVRKVWRHVSGRALIASISRPVSYTHLTLPTICSV